VTLMKSPQPFSLLRDRRESFDPVVIAVHWTTAIAVGAMFGLALFMDEAPDAVTPNLLLTLHQSLGMSICVLTAFRLTWRLTLAKLPSWPGSMSTAQRWAARLNEYGLYGLLLVQPVTGLLQSLYRGKAFELWTLTVPPLVRRDKAMVELFEGVHSAGAWVLAALVGLHATAALFHLFVRRDGIFESMAPILSRSASGAPRRRRGRRRRPSWE
jgi:cytochrome b561